MKKDKIRSPYFNNDGHIGWHELDFRDKLAYSIAIILIFSGIIMAFCCFFITEEHDITDGVLFFTAQTFVTGGSLLGIGVWIKGKFGEMNNYINNKLSNE